MQRLAVPAHEGTGGGISKTIEQYIVLWFGCRTAIAAGFYITEEIHSIFIIPAF
tara:strand:- start:25 stop:186 length:162 start_codon:yes stop_codon:yes gene_type:complete